MLQELFDGCLCIDPTQQTAKGLTECATPLPTCKGLVLFCDVDDRPVQFLIAANIRRTARNRLFTDETMEISKRADIARIVRKVYYLCCYNDFRSALKHYEIARILYPDSWRDMITLGAMWYVRIDPSAKWPNFTVTNRASLTGCEKTFGPFPTRKATSHFIRSLRTAFQLCLKPDLVDSPKKAATCPYFQMHSCPAPCMRLISKQEYLCCIDEAVAAAAGEVDKYATALRQEMAELSDQQNFEQAGIVKKRLCSLESLAGNDYRWTRDLSKLTILHIDRSAKITPDTGKRKVQSYSAFVIMADRIIELDDFTIDKIDVFQESVSACLNEESKRAAAGEISGQLALAAFFLYRSRPPGIWINCSAISSGCFPPAQDFILSAIDNKWPTSPEEQSK